jgi:hypothetical protein
MRRLAASVVCFFLLYAGAAQALEACLGHDGHSGHHFAGHHFDSGISAPHDHSRSPSWPIIHCPTAEQRLGPALQVASPNLNRSDLVRSVHPSILPETGFPVSRNGLWLEALFKRIFAFSLPNDLARHLFLSILQI